MRQTGLLENILLMAECLHYTGRSENSASALRVNPNWVPRKQPNNPPTVDLSIKKKITLVIY